MTIRPAIPADQAYVASTWTTSIVRWDKPRKFESHVQEKKWRRESKEMTVLVDRILDHPTTRVLVAVDDRENIDGWLCYSVLDRLHVVHYAYVRKHRRHHGIMRSLAKHAGLTPKGDLVYTFEGPTTAALRTNILAHAAHIPPTKFLEAK